MYLNYSNLNYVYCSSRKYPYPHQRGNFMHAPEIPFFEHKNNPFPKHWNFSEYYICNVCRPPIPYAKIVLARKCIQ